MAQWLELHLKETTITFAPCTVMALTAMVMCHDIPMDVPSLPCVRSRETVVMEAVSIFEIFVFSSRGHRGLPEYTCNNSRLLRF